MDENDVRVARVSPGGGWGKTFQENEMRFGVALTAMTLGLAVMAGTSFAQDGPGQGPPPEGQGGPEGQQGGPGGDRGGPGGGDRPRWDPAQMQQRVMERIKDQLKAPDDEWAVLQPKIEKVMTAQRNLRASEFGGWGRGPGGPGGEQRRGGGEGSGPGGVEQRRGGGEGGPRREGQPPQTELGKAAAELRTAVRSEDPNESDIEAKLTALRAAKVKAADELKTARGELKEVLTVQQEAALVLAGMLE